MRERAFSYFSKPFSLDALADMIRSAAEGPSWDEGIEILSATPAWIDLVARCDLQTAERLVQFINEIADFPDPERNVVATAFREILLNAIEHGAQFDPDEYVEISYVRARHMVMCRVKDPGKGFSLDELRHSALANPPDDPFRDAAHREEQGMRPGGYGVLVAQKLLDELIYDEKGNDVMLIKYLDPALGGQAQLAPGV
jgi:anti-sigma regulatory factor (Ser/Thr protein kinase)